MAHDTEPTERYLLMWPPYGDHIIFEPHDLHHLPDRIKEAEAQGVDRQLLAQNSGRERWRRPDAAPSTKGWAKSA